MRKFIVDLLDFLCLAFIIIATLGALVVGSSGYQGNIVFGILYAIVTFLASSVAMGAILALTEIAKNSRRILVLIEQKKP